MSASQYRRQVEAKRKQRLDAEKKTGEYRIKETARRTAAANARSAASKSNGSSTISAKLREAERADRDAAAAGKQASGWQDKATRYGKEEAILQTKLAKAERSEAEAEERRRKRQEQLRDQRLVADRLALEQRVSMTEARVTELRPPKPEKLRILLLGAGPAGDLRIGREQKRIRAAVQSALHRDFVELDVRPAATTDDLLDGVTGFRPHVVHFSGHSNETVIVFEEERDDHHDGLVVTSHAFGSAIRATDDPPLLVVLNSCHSAAQIDALVREVVPFAIGMSDEIEDGDAITYAARFYAALANGQSILSAHLSAQAALELGGLSGAELPTLASAEDADPGSAVLVRPAD